MSDFKDYRRKKEEEMRQRRRAVEDGEEKTFLGTISS